MAVIPVTSNKPATTATVTQTAAGVMSAPDESEKSAPVYSLLTQVFNGTTRLDSWMPYLVVFLDLTVLGSRGHMTPRGGSR